MFVYDILTRREQWRAKVSVGEALKNDFFSRTKINHSMFKVARTRAKAFNVYDEILSAKEQRELMQRTCYCTDQNQGNGKGKKMNWVTKIKYKDSVGISKKKRRRMLRLVKRRSSTALLTGIKCL